MTFDPEATAAEAHEALGASRLITPFTERDGAAPSIDQAYEVVARIRRLRGQRLVGRKIGFTNRGIWPLYGVNAPIWGDVTDQTLLTDPTIDLSPYAQPRLEPEIVLGLNAAPTPGMTETELAGCIEWVAPGFEIVQSVFRDWRFSSADTIIAGGLHGGLILGERAGATKDLLAALPDVAVSLRRNGAEVDKGRGANALDGPLSALRHLNELLASDAHNPPLAAGEMITTGTLTDAWPLTAGEVWTAGFSGGLTADLSITCR